MCACFQCQFAQPTAFLLFEISHTCVNIFLPYVYSLLSTWYVQGVYIMKYLPLPFPFKCDKCSSFTIVWIYKFAKLFYTLTLCFFQNYFETYFTFTHLIQFLKSCSYPSPADVSYIPAQNSYIPWMVGNNTLGVKNTYIQLGIIYCFCPLGTLEPRSMYIYTLDCQVVLWFGKNTNTQIGIHSLFLSFWALLYDHVHIHPAGWLEVRTQRLVQVQTIQMGIINSWVKILANHSFREGALGTSCDSLV